MLRACGEMNDGGDGYHTYNQTLTNKITYHYKTTLLPIGEKGKKEKGDEF